MNEVFGVVTPSNPETAQFFTETYHFYLQGRGVNQQKQETITYTALQPRRRLLKKTKLRGL
jgi:hypothetical protein